MKEMIFDGVGGDSPTTVPTARRVDQVALMARDGCGQRLRIFSGVQGLPQFLVNCAEFESNVMLRRKSRPLAPPL